MGYPQNSYSLLPATKRYEILCHRLVDENLYSAACLLLATNATPTAVTQLTPDLTFHWLLAGLVKHAEAVVLGRG